MEAKQAHWFTVHRIILGDMILNWFLGVILLVLPEEVDRVIGQAPIMPSALYRIIGVCFALFAVWQTWIVRREHIGAPGLIAAALLALIPLVMLTVALVFMGLPLRPVWRLVLWAGNSYMLFLGVWYLMLARMLRRTA